METTLDEQIASFLPDGFRLRWIPADLEGPVEIVVNFPDYYLFQEATKKGILGMFRGWKTFGYMQQYWPADTSKVIHIHSSEDLERYLRIVRQVLEEAELSGEVRIQTK